MGARYRRVLPKPLARNNLDCHCAPFDAAPTLLKFSEDQSHVFFARQPGDAAEETAAQAALEVCPTGSIGNDGN